MSSGSSGNIIAIPPTLPSLSQASPSSPVCHGEPSRSSSPSKSSANTAHQIALKYFLSCSAALVAETVTYPLDITKTRLQIIRKDAHWPKKSPGMLRITYDIVYTGIRLGTYEAVRDSWFNPEVEKSFPLWKSAMTGLVSGAFAQFVASPTDLVKVQLQMEGLRKLQNLPPRFTSTRDAFASLYRQNGFRGLWMGWVPNCQRAALLNMADLATYDRVKHWLLRDTSLQDDWLTHAISSACSGFMAALFSTPADVVKTRIMDQLRHLHDQEHRGSKKSVRIYSGSLDCLSHVVRKEGFWALYRGFIPIYIRMAPWSLTFWVSYEKIRWLTGASSF